MREAVDLLVLLYDAGLVEERNCTQNLPAGIAERSKRPKALCQMTPGPCVAQFLWRSASTSSAKAGVDCRLLG